MAKHTITEAFIRKAIADAGVISKTRIYYDDHAKAPQGFGLRVTKAGAPGFVLNYTVNGIERRATVGPHPDLSITAAREHAQKMRAQVITGGDPLADKAERKAKALADRAETERKANQTLHGLLNAYVAHLRAMKKPSAREVERMTAKYIATEKKLAAKPAADVTEDDVMPVLHKLTEAGTFREAEKMRSYLRAAYSSAKKARTSASMYAFKGFTIRTNPLAELSTIERPKGNRKLATPSKWALSEEQLGHYWRRILADESDHGPLLRFHLLTGGQRCEQLARPTADQFDAGMKAITLLDPKGRRRDAREHVVPLIPDAVKALAAMRGDKGPYLVSVSKGKTPVHDRTMWEAVNKHAAAMLEAGEVDRLFSPGAIRVTVETRLAARGVSKEIRGHLQSHGLHGVQHTHYDKHDYFREKYDVLLTLRAMLEPKGSAGNVTTIKRKRA